MLGGAEHHIGGEQKLPTVVLTSLAGHHETSDPHQGRGVIPRQWLSRQDNAVLAAEYVELALG